MARHIATGIDIGTFHVRVVIAEQVEENKNLVPKIIGTGYSESKGLHHGYITSSRDVTQNIEQAVAQAEKMAGVKVKRAFVSVGGIGLSGVTATGSTIISRADLEITDLDVSKVEESAESSIPHSIALNKKIINTIPVEFKADGKVVWGRVQGLKAQKLEAKILFIMCLEHHIQDLIKSVEDADIEVIDVVASPIAASFVTLSKKQKKAGCVLANIGAETLSIVVYENNTPISIEVFPIGGTDITNDIALGLKVPLEEAESIKLGSLTKSNHSKKKLEEIVNARLSDMFELIEVHLKKIGRNALLPAGIILTGGSAAIASIKEFAEHSLKLPSNLGDIHFGSDDKIKTKDSTWSVAYGLAIFGFNAENERMSIGTRGLDKVVSTGQDGIKKTVEWFKGLLP
ncbi:MAG: cell division protein FtsA [Minisyncoccia bacterium]